MLQFNEIHELYIQPTRSVKMMIKTLHVSLNIYANTETDSNVIEYSLTYTDGRLTHVLSHAKGNLTGGGGTT